MVAALAVPVAAALQISATAAATIVSVGLYVATTAASYFLQQALAPKEETGTKLKTVMGGAVNQSFIFGEKETAGSFLYRNSWGKSGGTPNAFLTKVYCLQDMRMEEATSRLWTDKKNTITLADNNSIDGHAVGHPVPAFEQDGKDHLWVKFRDGTETTADSYLTDVFGSGSRPWTSDMVGRGRTLAIVTQRYNKKEPEGEVNPLFTIKGIRLYDWRPGDQTYGTYSTYAYSANPVVVIYNIMRGVYYGTDWLYGGKNWPATRFDNDSFTAAANVCDENITLAAGGTEKRYRVGGEVALNEEPWSVIERLLKACNGRIVESGGVFKIYCGGIGASVFSFTDDDVIVSESLSGRHFPQREDIANTITGTYVEPDNAGEAKAYKSRSKAAYVTEDGGEERRIALDFEYVRNNRQAQRLALLSLNDNRRFRTFVVAFGSSARKLEPCDVVSWTSDRFGFTAKKFIVGDVTLRDDGIVVVNLREADSSDADWTTGDENTFETGVYGDVEATSQTLSATVTAVAITDDDDTTERRPAVRIVADVTEMDDCEALLWWVRKKNGDQAVIAHGRSVGFFDLTSPNYGDIRITDNAFLPGKQVQVQYQIDPESDRPTGLSAWVDLTLTNARMKIATPSADNDVDMVDTPNITIGAATRTQAKNSKDINSFTNSTAHSGNDFVIKSFSGGSARDWAIEIDNDNGSMIILDVDFTFLAKFAFNPITNPTYYAKGVLTLYRSDQGAARDIILRSWTVDATKKLKKDANTATDKKHIQDTIVAGPAIVATTRIYLRWNWSCRCSNGSCEASVTDASIQAFYGRR